MEQTEGGSLLQGVSNHMYVYLENPMSTVVMTKVKVSRFSDLSRSLSYRYTFLTPYFELYLTEPADSFQIIKLIV